MRNGEIKRERERVNKNLHKLEHLKSSNFVMCVFVFDFNLNYKNKKQKNKIKNDNKWNLKCTFK